MVIATKTITIQIKLQGSTQADVDEVTKNIEERMRRVVRYSKYFIGTGRRVRMMQLYE